MSEHTLGIPSSNHERDRVRQLVCDDPGLALDLEIRLAKGKLERLERVRAHRAQGKWGSCSTMERDHELRQTQAIIGGAGVAAFDGTSNICPGTENGYSISRCLICDTWVLHGSNGRPIKELDDTLGRKLSGDTRHYRRAD